jgi:membrane peptidoglycan carboxypeptidase
MQKIINLILLLGMAATIGIIVAYQKTYNSTPTVNEIITELNALGKPSQVYDRNGAIILQYGAKSKIALEWDDLKNSTYTDILVNTEDKSFWKHDGVDYRALARAAKGLLTGKKLGGGSTITQQLAKILYTKRGSSDMTKRIIQKWKEIVLAHKLENSLSKEEILVHYCNNMDYSQNTLGVASAAMRYYGKRFTDLSDIECVGLVAMLQNPVAFNPISNYQAWANKTMQLAQRVGVGGNTPKIIPHLEDGIKEFSILYYHIQQEMHLLGYTNLSNAGLQIYTSLDQKVQNSVEEMLQKHITTIKGADGAIVVMDSHGAIAGLAGGVYNQNWATSQRPIGSTAKPLIHGLAYDMNIVSPCTPWVDSSYTLIGRNYNLTDDYTPKNFSAHSGQTVRYGQALKQSFNNATVALLDNPYTGQKLLEQWGRLTRQRTITPASVLGAIDLSIIDLATIYTCFSPEHPGITKKKSLIETVRNSDNQVLFQAANASESMVMSVSTAGLFSQILCENGFAGKTGTTNNEKDALYAGWNNEFTIAIRIASRNGTSVGTGTQRAKPLAIKVFTFLHSYVPESRMGCTPVDYTTCITFEEDAQKLQHATAVDEVNEWSEWMKLI